jgi:hypothetical protein
MRKKILGLGVVVGVLAALGIAFAAWTATGTGSGRATATSAQSLTVNATTGTADLYPGQTQGDVYFTITNPNPYGVSFSSYTSTGSFTVDAGHPGCTVANSGVSIAPSGAVSPAVTAPASGTSGTQSIANIVTMASSSDNACQGASFDFQLTLSGTST